MDDSNFRRILGKKGCELSEEELLELQRHLDQLGHGRSGYVTQIERRQALLRQLEETQPSLIPVFFKKEESEKS